MDGLQKRLKEGKNCRQIMQKPNKFTFILFLLLISFLFLKALAFVIPDFEIIGKEPEIKGIESECLIPGQKIKIYGENFFEVPKSANKIWINNYPVRVLKSE